MSTPPSKNEPQKKASLLIPEEIRKALESAPIPEKQRKEIAVSIASYFQGPLPPPSLLREYNEVVRDGAERIFQKFESQSAHRQEMERMVIAEQLNQSRRGQKFGFVIALFGLALSAGMAYLGFEIYATSLASVTVVGLVTVFVVGKKSQRKDLDNKNK